MYYSGITLLKKTDDIAKISLYFVFSCVESIYIYKYIYIYIYIYVYIYVFMKTMCFVATHALGHMMYGCTVVPSYIYIYIYIYTFF